MGKYYLKLPKMGESIAEATLTSWLKNVGDKVDIDEPIVEIATDKVDSDVPSEYKGVLVKRNFEVDQIIKVGEVIAEIETDDIDVTNNEAIIKDEKSIGYITSGGFAHYVGKSIGYAYLDEEMLKSNEKFQVEINGTFYNSSIIKEALYDPKGEKMRS